MTGRGQGQHTSIWLSSCTRWILPSSLASARVRSASTFTRSSVRLNSSSCSPLQYRHPSLRLVSSVEEFLPATTSHVGRHTVCLTLLMSRASSVLMNLAWVMRLLSPGSRPAEITYDVRDASKASPDDADAAALQREVQVHDLAALHLAHPLQPQVQLQLRHRRWRWPVQAAARGATSLSAVALLRVAPGAAATHTTDHHPAQGQLTIYSPRHAIDVAAQTPFPWGCERRKKLMSFYT